MAVTTAVCQTSIRHTDRWTGGRTDGHIGGGGGVVVAAWIVNSPPPAYHVVCMDVTYMHVGIRHIEVEKKERRKDKNKVWRPVSACACGYETVVSAATLCTDLLSTYLGRYLRTYCYCRVSNTIHARSTGACAMPWFV